MTADSAALPVRLRDLDRCFMGAVPATISTCSPLGVPNITYLSVVHFVDDAHIALSFQFFNKTRENILANPRAQVLLIEPVRTAQYRLDVVYERTEREGSVFERLRTNLDAVASQTGMQGVFRLQGADVYRVLAIEKLPHDLDLSSEAPTDFVAALDALSARLAECEELDALLDACLAGLAEHFNCPHSMILFADGTGRRLYTVASRGFPESGVGAEIAVGEGLIGSAAKERRAVRVSNLAMEQTFAVAVRNTSRERGEMQGQREIALPGLPNTKSQIAVPILSLDRTIGVLCVQSEELGRLTMADELALSTVARHLAISIQLLGYGSVGDAPADRVYAKRAEGGARSIIRYHASDDSVFIGDEYLVKGLPGRILFRMLSVVDRDGRVDFTNRELRLDPTLQLGGHRDNLEARLILLRRRLEERCDWMRISKSGRGRFRLEVSRPFALREAEG